MLPMLKLPATVHKRHTAASSGQQSVRPTQPALRASIKAAQIGQQGQGQQLQQRRPVFVQAAATETLTRETVLRTSEPNIPRGETAGATLIVDCVTVQAGDRDLLSDVSWRLMPGQKVGLVGANGAGKSTLLKCLWGSREPESGSLMVAPKVEVGYLEQTAVSGSTNTVWEEARSRMTDIIEAEKAMEDAELRLEQGDVSAADDLAAAQEKYAAAGGYDSEKRITNVLTGLGFKPEQFHRPCSDFSGGWQMRIALARLLLGPAGQGAVDGTGGLLLLDEPTNHLDSAACKWLGQFLRSATGPQTSVVLVSHDEALLEDACTHIVEVRGRKLHHYVGGYKKFLEQRALRESQARAGAEAQQAEIARLEEFVARFGAKASKASQAQSRAKLLEKLKAEAVEVPAAAAAGAGGDAKKVTLRLPKAPPVYTEVIKLTNVSVGWGTPAPDKAPIVSRVNFTVRKGQRVLVLGPNGAGKSTLLKAIAGAIPLWDGTRQLGEGAKLAVFSQDLAQDLPLDKTALQYVEDVARADDPKTTMEKCRAVLGALGLNGTMALQKIGVLSGGEKARVALAGLAMVPSNVLLLDEASNHLDAQTIEVLTGALKEFDGAIVAITHNQAFANTLNATHILRVSGGGAKLEDNLGLSAKDFDHSTPAAAPAKAAAAAAPAPAPAASNGKKGSSSNGKAISSVDERAPSTSSSSSSSSAPASPSSSSASAKPKRTILAYSEQLEYKKLTKDMEVLGAKRDELQAKMNKAAAAGAAGYAEMEKLALELGKVVETLEEKELRWLELAEIAGDI